MIRFQPSPTTEIRTDLVRSTLHILSHKKNKVNKISARKTQIFTVAAKSLKSIRQSSQNCILTRGFLVEIRESCAEIPALFQNFVKVFDVFERFFEIGATLYEVYRPRDLF